MRGHIEIVRALLQKGAAVNDQDHNGRKAVDWARRLDRVEMKFYFERPRESEPRGSGAPFTAD